MLTVDQPALRVKGNPLVGAGELPCLYITGQLGDVVPVQSAIAFVGIQPVGGFSRGDLEDLIVGFMAGKVIGGDHYFDSFC